ncbi:hypothetical protein FJT64_020075 [Amphibalanus amphitrite]|uniref:Uncharacterized protein n=1 Tax=Amphibalanus amphitrite TaxID=1232801 RepID=A0A6A4X1N3_AMPAM|nr:hypothetical protein FJT64_020075 [Amphibalanus amphitrite]
MARCCCCFGLRTGSILIGMLLLLLDLAGVVWAGLSLAVDYDKLDLQTWPEVLQTQLARLDSQAQHIANWVVLGLAGAGLLTDLALIFGAASRRRCGQLLWLIWRALVFTLATLALLVLLGLSIWLLVDASAAEKLGLDDQTLVDAIQDAFRSEEERQTRRRNSYIALLVASVVGLVIMSVLWGWYGAVDRNQRRLRHATVIVKTQHMHTSRL